MTSSWESKSRPTNRADLRSEKKATFKFAEEFGIRPKLFRKARSGYKVRNRVKSWIRIRIEVNIQDL
jgi:hypothetical protein